MAVEDKIKNLLDMLDGYGYQYKLFDGKVVVENHSSDIIRAVEILEEFSKYNLIPMYRTTSFKNVPKLVYYSFMTKLEEIYKEEANRIGIEFKDFYLKERYKLKEYLEYMHASFSDYGTFIIDYYDTESLVIKCWPENSAVSLASNDRIKQYINKDTFTIDFNRVKNVDNQANLMYGYLEMIDEEPEFLEELIRNHSSSF